jgi:CheY-like chemotaxis protein
MGATPNEAERMNGGAPKRILIIAGINAARLRYAAVLKHEGFDVTAAANSSEALEHLEKQFFDLIVVDLHKGDPAGFRILYEIRSHYAALREVISIEDVPVLCLAGSGAGGSFAAARLLGMTAVLDKPVQLEELRERVRTILQNGSAPAGFHGRTMVVVDPAHQLGSFFRSRLEGLGWHVVQSGNPERMIAMLKIATADVVVLSLPALYDQEEGILNRFLEFAGRVPLLAIAGSEEQARRAVARFGDKAAALVRPFGVDALLSAIENARHSIVSGSSLPDMRRAS